MNPDLWLIEITVLKITQTSEHFLKLDYLSPVNGLDYGLLRFSPKNKKASRPDLFDTAEISIELGNVRKKHFLKDYSPITQRPAIGKHYSRLDYSCRFARFLLENLSSVPDPKELYQLSKQSLDAFNSGYPPETILLKALYRFLKIEGFPVENNWWQSIPQAQKNQAQQLLNTPLSEIQTTRVDKDALTQSPAESLLAHLAQWIRQETELRLNLKK